MDKIDGVFHTFAEAVTSRLQRPLSVQANCSFLGFVPKTKVQIKAKGEEETKASGQHTSRHHGVGHSSYQLPPCFASCLLSV
eukprot:1162100-Pelagomonas_calceolata.AAC.10